MRLYANPVDLARLGGASCGVVLIGAYSGDANRNDVLQLLSALEFHRSRNPEGVLVAAIDIEAQHHWRSALPPQYREVLVPLFAAEDDHLASATAGLQELSKHFISPPLLFLHFYGGDYANNDLGLRKRMCGETIVSALKHNPDVAYRVFITGVKVTPSDEAKLWEPLLRQASVIGVKDEASADYWRNLMVEADRNRIVVQTDDAFPVVYRYASPGPAVQAEAIRFHDGPAARLVAEDAVLHSPRTSVVAFTSSPVSASWEPQESKTQNQAAVLEMRDPVLAFPSPNPVDVSVAWCGLIAVREMMSDEIQAALDQQKQETTERLRVDYTQAVLALGELRRRLSLMEKHQANLEAELIAAKEARQIITPKRARRWKKSWRKLRSKFSLWPKVPKEARA